MIIETGKKDSQAQAFGVLEKREFEIGDASMVISYLRESIYKNPIMALCREYCSNARDAHVEVDSDPNNPTTKETPIEVTLPNEWNLEYKVKDFGPGISPERIDIFRKFGSSTKRETNEQLGAFGIGCKSGYAYGDTFNVETVHQGIKYIYNCFLDGGAGQIVLMHQQETKEPSGTTIIIPVRDKDRDSFLDYTIMVTSFWNTKPILKGRKDIPEYPSLEKNLEGKDWYILKHYAEHQPNQSLALMDGIPYPVDSWPLKNLTPFEKELLRQPLVMKFNIGDLLLAPSRDTLRYDERDTRTQEALKNKLSEIQEFFVEKLNREVINVPTYKEACKKYFQILSDYKNLTRLLPVPFWQGHQLMSWIDISSISGDVTEYEIRYSYKTGENRLYSTKQIYKIPFLEQETEIIYNDTGKKFTRPKIEWLLKNHLSNKRVFIISPVEEKQFDLDQLDRIGAKKLSSMPAIPKVKSQNNRRPKTEEGKVTAYRLSSGARYGSISTDLIDVDVDSGGVYVIFDYQDRKITSEDKVMVLGTLANLAEFIGIPSRSVYAFSPKRAEKLNDNWKTLNAKVKEKFEEILKTYSLQDIADIHTLNNKWGHKPELEDGLASILKELNSFLPFDQNHILNKYYLELDKIIKLPNNLDAGLSWLNINLPKASTQKKIEQLYSSVIASYPLLKHIDSCARVSDIVTYVRLVDEKNKPVKNILTLVN